MAARTAGTGPGLRIGRVTSAGAVDDSKMPRRRGRGRPPKSIEAIAKRRQDIIVAAYEVFAEKGYHASGIADIAEKLDLGHGTFYSYFDSKRDVLDHVLDYGVGEFLKALSIDDVESATTREELRAQVIGLGHRMYRESIDKDPRLPRLLVLEVSGIDEELLQRVLGLMESGIGMLVPVLADASRRGLLREDLDARSAARAMFGLMMSAILAETRAPLPPPERQRYLETVAAMLVDSRPSSPRP